MGDSLVFWLFMAITILAHFVFCTGNLKPAQRTTKFDIQKISGSLDSSIVNEIFTTDTGMKCASGCAEKRSASFYYVESTQTCHCNKDLDSRHRRPDDHHHPHGAEEILYGEAENIPEVSTAHRPIESLPIQRDCLQYYRNGFTTDDVYTIQPVGGAPVDTWCDMTHGGWTVFQRRQDGSENFFRNWTDYVTGFGDKRGEYWLGLENIHLLTKEQGELKVSLVAFGDRKPKSAYAKYAQCSIGNSSTGYTLSVEGYEGDCGDSLRHHDQRQFSTADRDNDASGADNCAIKYNGAWWFRRCGDSHLNGVYYNGRPETRCFGIVWYDCWGEYYSLKETVMKCDADTNSDVINPFTTLPRPYMYMSQMSFWSVYIGFVFAYMPRIY